MLTRRDTERHGVFCKHFTIYFHQSSSLSVSADTPLSLPASPQRAEASPQIWPSLPVNCLCGTWRQAAPRQTLWVNTETSFHSCLCNPTPHTPHTPHGRDTLISHNHNAHDGLWRFVCVCNIFVHWNQICAFVYKVNFEHSKDLF